MKWEQKYAQLLMSFHIDACYELSEQKAKLEREIPQLQNRVNSLVAEIKQAKAEHDQVKNAVSQTKQELLQIKGEYAASESKLEALHKRAESEKQRIDKELEDSYGQANVTREEVTTAGKLKADIERHGFTLELMLDLSREFAGHKSAREQLSEGLKTHGSLNKYLDKLSDFGKKEKSRVMAELAGPNVTFAKPTVETFFEVSIAPAPSLQRGQTYDHFQR